MPFLPWEHGRHDIYKLGFLLAELRAGRLMGPEWEQATLGLSPLLAFLVSKKGPGKPVPETLQSPGSFPEGSTG